MDLSDTLFQIIDIRSFSNLWFWIALAVMWATVSHWVLGVPNDMIIRARRNGGQAETDLEDLVRINCNRLLYIGQVSGLWLLGLGCFTLTGLLIMGFVYEIQLAQAVFLLALPMSLVGLLNLSSARLIADVQPTGEDLRRRLGRQRVYTQIIGMISIFVTSLWGMYQNMRDLVFLQ